MHRSTYCNITSSNIISYIQMLTNPWDSTVPQVRPKIQGGRSAFESEQKRKDFGRKSPVDS